MNTHTTIGAQILSGSDSAVIQMGERIALAHHEKWDGSGYPKGLANDEIPKEARICAVVDFFDALTMDRPYRAAVPNDQVVEMMLEGSGSHFDPEILECFMDIRPDIETIQDEYVDESEGEGEEEGVAEEEGVTAAE
jgi:putative two-component system response regulator